MANLEVKQFMPPAIGRDSQVSFIVLIIVGYNCVGDVFDNLIEVDHKTMKEKQ